MTEKEKILDRALRCRSYDEVDAFLKSIEDDESISDRQYYNLKNIALNSAYHFMVYGY